MKYFHILIIALCVPVAAQSQSFMLDGAGGYGFRNTQRVGLGLRVGYLFNPKVFLGLSYTYHFGSERVSQIPAFNQNGTIIPAVTVTTMGNIRHVQLDMGYQFTLKNLNIRPMFGVGVLGANARSEPSSIILDDSRGAVIARPALLLSVPLDKSFALGLEVSTIKSLNQFTPSLADWYSVFFVVSYSF
jgi:outer membrane protein W